MRGTARTVEPVASSSHAHPLERFESSVLRSVRHTFRLPAVDTSAAEARHRVLWQLNEWRMHADVREAAQLVISELVTNALRHTMSETVHCELWRRGTALRVSVASDGPGPAGVPPPAGDEDESGRGLFLVCAMAERWGVRPADAGHGHVVWADIGG